ncbi:permease [Texcoconibacillus texcoconensis]|uniref:Permease n=1 Tax=Texcoconibacillus texcoconensis TaxID=1095777 RepID=A0A840QNR5_9BACI|nr:permease [Texcoconibacillus texcoconensis]MBB5172998.1 hypothetical protein [Texcoconibacillus texcoconensis]
MSPPENRLFTIGKDLLGIILLLIFLILFLNFDRLNDSEMLNDIPSAWVNVNTIFLSIVIEAIPFILLGVFVSAIIQIYISEDTIQRYLPSNVYASLFPAAVLGAIFPLCECAIVPVVRRLIKKGMPLHVGVVFLVAAPILNPIVALSTFFAFRTDLTILYSRMGLAFFLSIIIGAIIYIVMKNEKGSVLRSTKSADDHHHHHHHHQPSGFTGRMRQMSYHAVDEFFMMGKYLILGAFIAALFQTFLDRATLMAIGGNDFTAPIVMMAFAYLLSLCSEADAFVASSFSNQFTSGSLVAFLVYGPMLDLKNTFMLFAFFKTRFVLVFMITVTIVVFIAVLLLQMFLL